MTKRRIDLFGATSMVVANMVGTGVFTSLGFQLFSVETGFSVVMIWLVGGILALLGAFCYAEVASRLPEDGGEFYFLSKIYHPAIGYMAGFVSSTVGFAAPIAGASLALGAYINGVWPSINAKLLASVIVIIISVIHANSLKLGMFFQKISTVMKLIIIVIFIAAGFILAKQQGVTFSPIPNKSFTEIWKNGWFSSGFAISLVWVSFAYSGWNASAYIAGSIKNPSKNLSRSILYGTAIVVVLYVLLNMVFFKAFSPSEIVSMKGKPEIGLLAARELFGIQFGDIMGAIISVLLISTISSMIFTGPRVLQSMFKDIPALSALGKHKEDGTPRNAIIFQGVLSLFLLYTMNFQSLIYYVAFTLSLFTILTVIGMMILRIKKGKPDGYRAWGYPITPIVFISMTGMVAWFFMNERPLESLLGLTTSLIGLALYGFKSNGKLSK